MKRRSLLDNILFVRLLSIVLGFLLWVVVSSSPNTQGNGLATTTQVLHNIPVIVLTSPQMMAVTERPVRLNVSISGSILDVATVQASASGIRAVANATTMGPGIHRVPIIIENTPTSAVTYVPETPYAVVNIQEKVASPFPLSVKVVGKPAAGLRLGAPIASVSQVVVSGPNTLVHQVVAVKAAADVTGSLQSVTRMVPVLPVNRKGQVVQGVFCNPETVTLTVPILSPVHLMDLVPEVSGTPNSKWAVSSVKVSPSTITVIGEPQTAISPYLTLPPININHYTGTKTVSVGIPLPFPGAKLNTPVAKVTVIIAPSIQFVLQGVPVKLVGIPKGLNVGIQGSPYIQVTLSGAVNLLQNIQVQDINAYADVSGLKKGKTKNVRIAVAAPVNVKVVQISATTIKVKAN